MAVALALLTLLSAAPAWACPTCGCANPALTSIGADQPFANRVRFAAAVRAWAQRDGTAGEDLAELRELRMDLTASWAVVRRVTLQLNVPLQARERTNVSLQRERGFHLGEVELSARVLLVGAEGLRPRHLLSVVATSRFPTAPTLVGPNGVPFAVDAQLGSGAWVPGGGVLSSVFIGDTWSLFNGLLFEVPFEGRYGLRLGPTANLVSSAQYQPWARFGLRAGLDARYELASWERGVAVRSQEGFLLQALAEVVFSPISTVLLTGGARLPLLDLRVGPVWSSPIALLSVVVDV